MSIDELEVLGGGFAVLSGLKLIGDLLAFVEGAQSGAFDGRNVDKGILGVVIGPNEAEAPVGVEKLYSTCGHVRFL